MFDIPFVNRDGEIEESIEFLRTATRKNVLVWRCAPRSGMTSYLKHLQNSLAKEKVSIYIDGNNQIANSIFGQVVISLFNQYPIIFKSFENFVLRKTNDAEGLQWLDAIVEIIPYIKEVSPIFQKVKRKTSLRINSTNYPSLAAELLSTFLKEFTDEQGVAIFIDNAHSLDDSSFDILATASDQLNLKFIFSWSKNINDSVSLETFDKKIRVRGRGLITKNFPPPSGEMAKKIGGKMSITISAVEAASICTAANGDIYNIVIALRQINYRELDDKIFEEIAPRFILRCLLTSKQSLRFTDLSTLFIKQELFYGSEDLFEETMLLLEHSGVVESVGLPSGDRMINLVQNTFVKQKITQTTSERLVMQGLLYDFYIQSYELSERHSAAECIPLLYRLSKIVDSKAVPKWMQEAMSLSLAMGTASISKAFISELVETTENHRFQDEMDLTTYVSFLISIKNYENAKSIIEANDRQLDRRYIRALYGVVLNRCKDHLESEKILEEQFITSTSEEEQVFLLSFRIIGLLHMDQASEGRELFNKYSLKLKEASNYGYLLRNGAAPFSGSPSIKILDEAIRWFINKGDNFGLATAKCNRATHLSTNGRTTDALADLFDALKILEAFGVHHLHLVYGNIGQCYLYRSDFEMAEKYLLKAIHLMNGGLPEVYAKLNLAAVYALQRKCDSACEIISDMWALSKTIKFDRGNQRTSINGLVILSYCNEKDELLSKFKHAALKHEDRYDPDLNKTIVDRLNELIESKNKFNEKSFFELFQPCSLQYWYYNPLQGLPYELLTNKTDI